MIVIPAAIASPVKNNSQLTCRAIYDQSYEDVAWRVGDNNGMPNDSNTPLSDLAQSIAQHDGPRHPTPNPSSTPSSSDSADRTDDKQQSISSRVQSAIRQAARMDSVGEGEQAKQDKRWQQTAPLQTIALDEHDLPPSASSPQVGLLWHSCLEVATHVSSGSVIILAEVHSHH